MVFSSISFVCVFFPLTVIIYYLLPSVTVRNYFLVASSLVFYAYGERQYVLLMIACAFFNYVSARLMTHFVKARRLLLFGVVASNLGMLGIFKYSNMIAATVNKLVNWRLMLPDIRLPVGISFFIFQALSYVVDVYRGKVQAEKSFLKILLYISLFPQLIAGPIIKYHSISEQIDNRNVNLDKMCQGMRRFIIGLSKKVLLADTMAVAADYVFALEQGELGMLAAWTGAVSYMLQIYFDFSGYSDMAIGMGRIFGFNFAENFQMPYAAASIQTFWKRWHISLTDWFREYLYIPLGGNRKGKARTWLNRMIVFFCTGLWHGANWTYVVWGLFHGALISLETVFPNFPKKLKVFSHAYVLLAVCVGFVIFRADTMGQAMAVLSAMFGCFEWNAQIEAATMKTYNGLFLFVFAVSVICTMPIREWVEASGVQWLMIRNRQVISGIGYLCTIILLALCIMSMAGGTYHPFIYFRF